MQREPKNMRLHIAVCGRRNVGKSSILNAITGQQVSIVSDIAGTTTDPVEKPMELLPLGPVLFIDTAGVDDIGALGELRVEKTKQVFERADLGIVVTAQGIWGEYESQLVAQLQKRSLPMLIVFNQCDIAAPAPKLLEQLRGQGRKVLLTIAIKNEGIQELRQTIVQLAPDDFINRPAIVADLVPPGACVVLVVPIDKEAPKGRLILPQVQVIRDLLDHDAWCVVVKERELREALSQLIKPPALVVTDSQAFLKVSGDTPNAVPMTSFSILFARYQGDLNAMVAGAMAIESLKPGDKILVAEACSHHPITEDIGTVKIPRWLTQYVGGKLDFTHMRGRDFPEDLKAYKLVIHCGACMWNRRAMLSRILRCREAGVPITNYGLAIAYSLGIFTRALKPFPGALDIYLSNASNQHEIGSGKQS